MGLAGDRQTVDALYTLYKHFLHFGALALDLCASLMSGHQLLARVMHSTLRVCHQCTLLHCYVCTEAPCLGSSPCSEASSMPYIAAVTLPCVATPRNACSDLLVWAFAVDMLLLHPVGCQGDCFVHLLFKPAGCMADTAVGGTCNHLGHQLAWHDCGVKQGCSWVGRLLSGTALPPYCACCHLPCGGDARAGAAMTWLKRTALMGGLAAVCAHRTCVVLSCCWRTALYGHGMSKHALAAAALPSQLCPFAAGTTCGPVHTCV